MCSLQCYFCYFVLFGIFYFQVFIRKVQFPPENIWQGFSSGKKQSVTRQRSKKVVSDSLGLVDFAIGLVNSVFNLPDGQVMFFEEFE